MNSCPQVDIGSFDQSGTSLCPSDTKLGTAAVDIAGFPSTISGGIYFAGEFEGGYFAYLLASGSEYDVVLPIFIEEDPETGLAIVGFESLPQIPIDELKLHFFAADETLETVNKCGSFHAKSYFGPWDSALSIQFGINEFVLNSGPGGTACPGPASNVTVSLSPTAISANGVSATTATAHVTDANGGPAIGDRVEFHSSDTGQRIGPVTETGDGIYTATITASTTPGSVTITAADTSVTPNVSGSATLEQTGGPLLVNAAPVTRITRHPAHRSRNRRPIFAFTSSVPRSTFSCSVDKKPFRPCTSPLRLKGLAPGGHRFRVLAIGPAGVKGEPVVFHFRVLKRAGSASRSR
jgi:hypothetical protein